MLTRHLKVGLPYWKKAGVMEIYQPLIDIAVDHAHVLREAGQKYLAEKGTVFTMSDVKDIEFQREKDHGIIQSEISMNLYGEVFIVPKFAVKRFLTRLFGATTFAALTEMPEYVRNICLEGMFDMEGNKEFQLLHNYDNEVLGVASPAYTFIPTIETALLTERVLMEHLPNADYHYRFSKQYGFRAFIYDQDRTALREVGDVRKMIVERNFHSGCNAFRLVPGLERLACTNGMTSTENYPGIRIIHLSDDPTNPDALTDKVQRQIQEQIKAIESLFEHLEYSIEISVPYESAKLFLSRLPRLPKKIQGHLERSLEARVVNNRTRLYDIQYVLSDIASNHLTKPQHDGYSAKAMNLAGSSIDPELFDKIVEEQRRRLEDDDEKEKEEPHTVKVEFL